MNVGGIGAAGAGASMGGASAGTGNASTAGFSAGDRVSFNMGNSTINGTLDKLGEMSSNILDDMGQMWNVPNMMIMISKEEDDDEEKRTTIIMAGSNPFGGMNSQQLADFMADLNSFNEQLAARNGFGSYLHMAKTAERQVGPSATMPTAQSVAPSGASAAAAYGAGQAASGGQGQGGGAAAPAAGGAAGGGAAAGGMG